MKSRTILEKGEVIKLMIVGDYLIFRNGLKRLLENEACFKVVCELGDLSTASVEINKNSPDIVIVNSTEAENSDFKTFFTECCDDIPVIVLTGSKEARTHQKYLLLGAGGVVTKEQSPEILFKAIKHVYKEDLWFERKVMLQTISKLVEEKQNMPAAVHSPKYTALTDREWEVLKGICKGMKNKTLAETLFISETTVRHHLTSIFEKLNVKSRLALAILAFNDGVVEVPKENGNGNSSAKYH